MQGRPASTRCQDMRSCDVERSDLGDQVAGIAQRRLLVEGETGPSPGAGWLVLGQK